MAGRKRDRSSFESVELLCTSEMATVDLRYFVQFARCNNTPTLEPGRLFRKWWRRGRVELQTWAQRSLMHSVISLWPWPAWRTPLRIQLKFVGTVKSGFVNGNQILARRYLVTEPADRYISKCNRTTNQYSSHQTQKPVGVAPCQFDSDLRHHCLITN